MEELDVDTGARECACCPAASEETGSAVESDQEISERRGRHGGRESQNSVRCASSVTIPILAHV